MPVHAEPVTETSEKEMDDAKRPRGRPPSGCVFVNGEYLMTEEGAQRAAERVEIHRAQCKARYRASKLRLMEVRPEVGLSPMNELVRCLGFRSYFFCSQMVSFRFSSFSAGSLLKT